MSVGTPDIDDAFVKQFESDVHLAFQRQGAKLLNTVRRKTGVRGESTTFQKMGKGQVGQKARHGLIPTFNTTHDPILCTLTDYYGGEYVDKLDELKVQHDEKSALSTTIANALGRQADALVIAAAEASGNQTTDTGVLTQGKVEEVYEYFGNNDVPDDGERYLWVSPQGWTDLMGLATFASLDYTSTEVYNGTPMKQWFSFKIAQHSGLSKAAAVRKSLAYHKVAVGAASGAEVSVSMDWVPERAATLVSGSMSMGSVIIDSTGVYIVRHTES
jgi:hypothetical protein